MAEQMLVRIKPYNPKKGHLRKCHIEQRFGMRFKEGAGWYEVPAHVARELRKVLHDANDPESAEVFDVVTKAVAHEIRQHEEMKIEKLKASPESAIKLRVRKPVGQRSPDDQAEEELTELAQQEYQPAPRARQPETRAARAVKDAYSRPAPASTPAQDDDADMSEFDGADEADEGVPYGADPNDADLSDVEAAEDPPTASFDAPVRKGPGRPRKDVAGSGSGARKK